MMMTDVMILLVPYLPCLKHTSAWWGQEVEEDTLFTSETII